MEESAKSATAKWWNLRDGLVIFCFVAVAIWFVGGFFFPDPRLNNWEVRHSRLFTILIRFSIYAAVAGLLIFVPIFYIAVRSGRIRMRVVGAFFGLIAMALLVLYLPVSAVYEEKMRAANPVHPYLQLFPPASEAPPKEEGELRVVCLGGSTTEWPSSSSASRSR